MEKLNRYQRETCIRIAKNDERKEFWGALGCVVGIAVLAWMGMVIL